MASLSFNIYILIIIISIYIHFNLEREEIMNGINWTHLLTLTLSPEKGSNELKTRATLVKPYQWVLLHM